LAACQTRLDAALPAIDQLEQALVEQRSRLAQRWSQQWCDDLIARRRAWEQRLLADVAGRWGFSPFSLLLRLYLGLGGLLSGLVLLRMRTPTQAALWGAWEGTRRWRKRRRARDADLPGGGSQAL